MFILITLFELFLCFTSIYYIHAYNNGISSLFIRKTLLVQDIDNQMEHVKNVVCKDDKYCFVATISNNEDTQGYPYGSVLGYALNQNGIPIMAVDKDSRDIRHLEDNNSVSLVITTSSQERIVYTGDVREVSNDFYDPNDEFLNYKALFIDAHPDAVWLEFPSVRFYVLEYIKNIIYHNTYNEYNVHLTKYMKWFN